MWYLIKLTVIDEKNKQIKPLGWVCSESKNGKKKNVYGLDLYVILHIDLIYENFSPIFASKLNPNLK